jgi:hypothetical protein
MKKKELAFLLLESVLLRGGKFLEDSTFRQQQAVDGAGPGAAGGYVLA